MSRLSTVLNSLGTQPGYTLMRGVARFGGVRSMVTGLRSVLQAARQRRLLDHCSARRAASWFADLDREAFVQQLRDQGIAFGLKLPPAAVAEIRAWAEQQPCYADREPQFALFNHGAVHERRTASAGPTRLT